MADRRRERRVDASALAGVLRLATREQMRPPGALATKGGCCGGIGEGVVALQRMRGRESWTAENDKD